MQDTFTAAAGDLTGDEALAAMADSYTRLLDDRTLLLLQMQIYAACSDPEIRDATRAAYKRLWEMVERITGLPFQTVVDFFAVGMLMNVAAAMDLPVRRRALDELVPEGCGRLPQGLIRPWPAAPDRSPSADPPVPGYFFNPTS